VTTTLVDNSVKLLREKLYWVH